MSEQWTLFAADTLASHLVSPGSDKARQMTVTSGLRCIGSWLNSGPLGSLERTLLGTSTWGSTMCFLTWNEAATPAGRLLFRLSPSEPITDGSESGLLATPTAKANQLAPSMQKWPSCAQLWPTPHGFSKDGKSNGPSGNELGRAVNRSLWGTPTARDWRDGASIGNAPINGLLGRQVGPTPENGSLNPT